MPAILNLSQELLELSRRQINERRLLEALKTLRRLTSMPNLPPSLAAEAQRLMAQVHLERSDYTQARARLANALRHDPDNADIHFLLAQTNERDDVAGCPHRALKHYAKAVQLDPKDVRKRSEYALRLATRKDAARGLRMLEQTYAENSSDPTVVEHFVKGLIETDRCDDAELVMTQAQHRLGHDQRFASVRRRLDSQIKSARLYSAKGGDGASAEPFIVPFRNFSGDVKAPTPTPRAKPIRKPESVSAAPASLSAELDVASILKRMEPTIAVGIARAIGLDSDGKPATIRKRIAEALTSPRRLTAILAKLPASTRKLLKTVVRSGGCVPASVLFQTAGPEAPPPNYVQPLLQMGLMFLGAESGAPTDRLIAMIPADVLYAVASPLRVTVGE